SSPRLLPRLDDVDRGRFRRLLASQAPCLAAKDQHQKNDSDGCDRDSTPTADDRHRWHSLDGVMVNYPSTPASSCTFSAPSLAAAMFMVPRTETSFPWPERCPARQAVF